MAFPLWPTVEIDLLSHVAKKKIYTFQNRIFLLNFLCFPREFFGVEQTKKTIQNSSEPVLHKLCGWLLSFPPLFCRRWCLSLHLSVSPQECTALSGVIEEQHIRACGGELATTTTIPRSSSVTVFPPWLEYLSLCNKPTVSSNEYRNDFIWSYLSLGVIVPKFRRLNTVWSDLCRVWQASHSPELVWLMLQSPVQLCSWFTRDWQCSLWKCVTSF